METKSTLNTNEPFSFSLGVVMTDKGKKDAVEFGFNPEDSSAGDTSFLSPKQSAESIKAVVDASTIQYHGGKFLDYDGTGLPW